jgi:K+ transporter
MVAHWWKSQERGALASMAVNGLGAAATAVTVVVVAVVKFMAGAWMVVLLVPSLVVLMLAVRRHYRRIEREIAAPSNLKLENFQEPIVIADRNPLSLGSRLSTAARVSNRLQVTQVSRGRHYSATRRRSEPDHPCSLSERRQTQP